MGMGTNSGENLSKFFANVAKINEILKEIKELHRKLRAAHEETKTAYNADVVKALWSKTKQDANLTLKRVKLIKDPEKSNKASRNLPECAPGSSLTALGHLLSGLGKKLKEKNEEF
ncbi:hypothetical protein RDABS01_015584 [Bienertia sinuspersici]